MMKNKSGRPMSPAMADQSSPDVWLWWLVLSRDLEAFHFIYHVYNQGTYNGESFPLSGNLGCDFSDFINKKEGARDKYVPSYGKELGCIKMPSPMSSSLLIPSLPRDEYDSYS